jgi:hypothetical protein
MGLCEQGESEVLFLSSLTFLASPIHPEEIPSTVREFKPVPLGRESTYTSPFCAILEDHLPGLPFPFSSGCSSLAQYVLKVLTSQSNMQQLVIDHSPHFIGPVEVVAFQ